MLAPTGDISVTPTVTANGTDQYRGNALCARFTDKKTKIIAEGCLRIRTTLIGGNRKIVLLAISLILPIIHTAQVLIVAEDDTVFADCKSAEDIENVLAAQAKTFTVGTQTATTGYMYSAGDEDFGYDGFKNLETKSYSNGALAAKDLSNGKINAVIIDKQPALMIVKNING